MSFDELLHAAISREVSHHIESILSSLEIYPQLPEVATTGEIAAQFRVSDDVVRRMCADGMPHVHAGRELRFSKKLLIEWSHSGRIFLCELCTEKSFRNASLDNSDIRKNTFLNPQSGVKISDKTSTKLSKLAK